MRVILDGEEKNIDDGAVLGDLIPGLDPVYSVAVIKPSVSSEITTKNFRIATEEGEAVLELNEEIGSAAAIKLLEALFERKELLPLRLRWQDRYSAAFGPFQSDIVPDKDVHRYSRGDIILGCGGYDPRNSVLIFSRSDHMADHGADSTGGVVGRVVSGLGVLNRWTRGSTIEDTERIISRIETGNSFNTTDRGLALEEGMEIVTHVRISASGYGKKSVDPSGSGSVEHMLLALSEERYEVSLRSSTFLSDEKFTDSIVPYEIKRPRLEGTVTVRTKGRKMGSVYVYLKDIPSSPAHTVTGQVEHGIELVKLASDGETLHILAEPPQIDMRGMRISDAIALAAERDFEVECDSVEEDRIVVEQEPPTTMEILAAGKAALKTVPASDVIMIRLDDEAAPRTCRIFREITGLKWYRIGKLPLIFKYDDVALFRPKIPKKTTINLENLPSGEVPANTLAITNDSRKGKGLVGVRRNPNSEFGPTSEPFEGTNILGTVIDAEKLDRLDEGGIVYLMEEES